MKNQTVIRKALALLLVLFVAVSSIPMAAIAEETGVGDTTQNEPDHEHVYMYGYICRRSQKKIKDNFAFSIKVVRNYRLDDKTIDLFYH